MASSFFAGNGILGATEPPAVAVVPGGLGEGGEDAPDLVVVGAPAGVEAHALGAAFEQGNFQMLLQHADAVGDGWGGDAELGPGADEVFVPGGGVEEAEAIEGWEVLHGRWPDGLPIPSYRFTSSLTTIILL